MGDTQITIYCFKIWQCNIKLNVSSEKNIPTLKPKYINDNDNTVK